MQEPYVLSQFPEAIRSHHMKSYEPVSFTYHLHDAYEIYVFLNGKADFYVEQNRYPLRRGTLLLLNSREIHRYIVHDQTPYERISTHFDPVPVRSFCAGKSNLLSCFEDRPNAAANTTLLNETELSEYIALTDKLHQAMAADEFGSDTLAASYLLQLLVLVNRYFHTSSPLPDHTVPKPSYQVMQYINAHIGERFTVKELADHFYLSPSYLSRQFHQQTGCSLQEYLILKRIALAKALLAEGKSVSAACDESGFQDYSNFIRTFKKYSGISPGQYGKKNEKRNHYAES